MPRYDINEKTYFEWNTAIVSGKESINENHGTQKRFEIMACTVFRKFKACLNVTGARQSSLAYDAFDIVNKCFQEDLDQANISQITKDRHRNIGESINVTYRENGEDGRLYDISAIDSAGCVGVSQKVRGKVHRSSISKS